MRLLVVEDEKKLAEFVARGLRDELYAVDISHDGENAWEMARDCDYDLIILDLMLPGVSGTDLLKRLRLHGSKAPVLILTARDSTAEKVLNFETGADDYLTKPFAFAELVVRIKALLRRGATERSNVLRVEDLELDRVNRRVKRAGKKIDLTVKEYSLLEFLVSNPGRVLSRRVIIDHVWDASFEGLAKIVDVHIGNLRAKMDTGYPTRLIHTVRGIGYSMEVQPAS
jgi:two-component system copper resistance phosphate regulon response regulator CusR